MSVRRHQTRTSGFFQAQSQKKACTWLGVRRLLTPVVAKPEEVCEGAPSESASLPCAGRVRMAERSGLAAIGKGTEFPCRGKASAEEPHRDSVPDNPREPITFHCPVAQGIERFPPKEWVVRSIRIGTKCRNAGNGAGRGFLSHRQTDTTIPYLCRRGGAVTLFSVSRNCPGVRVVELRAVNPNVAGSTPAGAARACSSVGQSK